jgi:hypothetical protein
MKFANATNLDRKTRGSFLALFEAQGIEGAAQLGAKSFHC